jgi:hypothetical protein
MRPLLANQLLLLLRRIEALKEKHITYKHTYKKFIYFFQCNCIIRCHKNPQQKFTFEKNQHKKKLIAKLNNY